VNPMKAYGDVEVRLDTFLSSILRRSELSASHPGSFTLTKSLRGP